MNEAKPGRKKENQFEKAKSGVYILCDEGIWHQTIYRCKVCGRGVCPRHQKQHAKAEAQ